MRTPTRQLCGGSMDIFWNYTLRFSSLVFFLGQKFWCQVFFWIRSMKLLWIPPPPSPVIHTAEYTPWGLNPEHSKQCWEYPLGLHVSHASPMTRSVKELCRGWFKALLNFFSLYIASLWHISTLANQVSFDLKAILYSFHGDWAPLLISVPYQRKGQVYYFGRRVYPKIVMKNPLFIHHHNGNHHL